jgi:hypothetical protein
MSWSPCPVCSTKNPPAAMRCSACGAAFDDPDVQAMAGEAAAMSSSRLGEAGAISASRFLGFSLDALADGSAARRLAIIGSGLLVAGFLAPLTVDYQNVAWTWQVLDVGPALALLFPAAAILIALGLALAPLPDRIRAGALAALGLAGIATLPFLGRFAGAPSAPINPFFLVAPFIAAAIAFRLHSPRSQAARRALAITAGLGLVALFIPVPGAAQLLPIELRSGQGSSAAGSIAGTFIDVFHPFPTILFLCLMALLPLALLPAAVALGWPAPKGVWDTGGKLLRPVGWFVALYVPLSFFLLAFNVAGWDFPGFVATGDQVVTVSDFVKTTMIGRIKLGLLAAGFSLWAALGAVALVIRPERAARTG